MEFSLYFLNPPYGDMHLKILERVLKRKYFMVVCLHPARWYEDPLAYMKQFSDREIYHEGIVKKMSSVHFLSSIDCNNSFSMGINGDMMISIFHGGEFHVLENVFSPMAERCIRKILSHMNDVISSHVEEGRNDGVRCKINALLPPSSNGRRKGRSNRMKPVELVDLFSECVYTDGKLRDGRDWTCSKNPSAFSHKEGDKIPLSIPFHSLHEAENFRDSCRERFYLNWIYMIKFDMHSPLYACPFMGSYEERWTHDMYCKYFHLSPEEAQFMGREIYDYRVKDFITYMKF